MEKENQNKMGILSCGICSNADIYLCWLWFWVRVFSSVTYVVVGALGSCVM